MTEHREPLGMTVTRAQIRSVLRLGHEFDINRGGLYDARSGCVNVWCSPEDKPACWKQMIDCGALAYPREYVGDLTWEWTDDETVQLFIEATPYALFDNRAPRRRFDLEPDEWQEVMRWLREKAHTLLKAAAIAPPVIGLHCPFCRYLPPEGELLNVLVEHVAKKHPERGIQGVILGDGAWLDCDGDSIPLVEVTEARG